MAATEKSEKQGRYSLKSWKLITENTLQLTHDDGVHSYQVDDISEIEIEFSEKPFQKFDFVWEYFIYGLLGLIIFPCIAAFFDRYPNKNYLAEFEVYFSLGFVLAFLFFLTPIGSVVLGLIAHLTGDRVLLVKTEIIGRELNIYSVSQGKKEYLIENKNLENVMTDDFFEVLFTKSTSLKTIFNDAEFGTDLVFSQITERSGTSSFYNREFLGHVILFIFTFLNISGICFFYQPIKVKLIPLLSINIVLLLRELFFMVDSKKSQRRAKKYEGNPNYDSKYQVSIKDDEIGCLNSIQRLHHGSMENLEIIKKYRSVYIETIDGEFCVFSDMNGTPYGGSIRLLQLIQSSGVAYYLKQQKSKGKWIVIFEKYV